MSKLTLKELSEKVRTDKHTGKRSVKLSVSDAISDIYSNMSVQGGINLVKNWSFENGSSGIPYYWDNEIYGVKDDLKIGISQDSISPLTGNYCGKISVTKFAKGHISSSWESDDYSVFYAGSSDAIRIKPNTNIYRCNFHVKQFNNLPVQPIVRVRFLAYRDLSGQNYIETLKSNTFLEINSAWDSNNTNIDLSHNNSIKSIRIFFELKVPKRVNISQPRYELYFDCISFYAGRLVGGASPFVLTEDTWSADIAEKYIFSDGNAEVGKIVTFGRPISGKPSLRIANKGDNKKRLFCVTNSYFFSLSDKNSFDDNFSECDIALIGRVECLVQGLIEVGDNITIMDNGIGRVARNGDSVVGTAITENSGDYGKIFIIVGK